MRLKFLDIAKGLAIILVVLGHFIPDGAPQWYICLREVIYSFHMPLFLFVSGFVCVYSLNNVSYGLFLKKKVKRIAIPYLVVSFIFILIKFLPQALGLYVKNPVTAASFIKVFYYPEAAVSFWYLWALWWYYMILPLAKTKSARVFLLVVALIFSYLPVELPDLFALPKAKEMFPYFMFGAVAADWRAELARYRRIPSPVWGLLFAALVVLWILMDVKLTVALALSGTVCVLSISADIAPYVEQGRYKWLNVVSGSSYAIYMLHPIFIAAILAFIHATGMSLVSSWIYAATAIAAVLISVSGPVVVDRLLNRWRIGLFS